MANNKFKIGDTVIGNAKANEAYRITRQGWIGKVIKIYSDEMIRVAEHETNDVGYAVHSKYFDLYKPTNNKFKKEDKNMAKKKFKIGDMVIGNAKANTEYRVTRQGWIGKVTDTYPDGTISVKSTEDIMSVGSLLFPASFTVHSKYFDLYKPTKADSEDPNVLRGKANSSKRILIEVSKEDPTVIKAKYIRGKEYSNEEAYATCSKHDIFDFKTGAKIAFDRIMNVIEDIDGEEKHEEPEKLLNCRFVVTSTPTSSVSGLSYKEALTSGYIYTIRNGKIILGDSHCLELPLTYGAFLKSQRDLEWYLGSREDRDHMREHGTAPDKEDPLHNAAYKYGRRVTFKIIEGEVEG